MTVAQVAERKALYRRFRNLSDQDAARVLQLIDELEDPEPNEETLAALKESERIAHDPLVKGYSSAAAMMADILADV